MVSAEFLIPIGENLYKIEEILSIFSIYQNTTNPFEIVLAHYDHDNPCYFLNVNGESIVVIDSSENREWHIKLNALGSPWRIIDATKVDSSIRNDLFNFLSERQNREKLMSDFKWEEEIKQKNYH